MLFWRTLSFLYLFAEKELKEFEAKLLWRGFVDNGSESIELFALGVLLFKALLNIELEFFSSTWFNLFESSLSETRWLKYSLSFWLYSSTLTTLAFDWLAKTSTMNGLMTETFLELRYLMLHLFFLDTNEHLLSGAEFIVNERWDWDLKRLFELLEETDTLCYRLGLDKSKISDCSDCSLMLLKEISDTML